MPRRNRLPLYSRNVGSAVVPVEHDCRARRCAYILILLIVSLAGARHAWCGQNTVAQGEQKVSSIRGRVINKVTSEPIARARVLLEIDRQLNLAPPTTHEAAADAEGKFVLSGLASGRYSLVAESAGFVGAGPSRNASGATGMLIEVGEGRNLDRLEIGLVPTASISGRVTVPDGAPLRNAEVTLLGRYYPAGREIYQPVASGRTDDRGDYRIFDLPPGQYALSATPRAARNASPRTGPVPDTIPEADFGTIIYPNAAVPSEGSQIQLAPGQELYGIDVRMEKRRNIEIVGKVVKPKGTGVASLWLTPEWLAGRPGPRRVIESPDGAFAFSGVAPGRYSIIAIATTTNEGTVSGKAFVEVGEDNPVRTEIVLSGGGVLRGRIVMSDDGSLPGEAKHLALAPFEPGGVVFAAVRAAEIARDGSFELSRVGTDRYRIQIGDLPDNYYVSAAHLEDEEVLTAGIDGSVGFPSSAVLRIVLSSDAARIAGAVESRDGHPVAGATVVLIPEDRERRTQFYRCPWTTTDTFGKFSIAHVEPMKYRALAWREVALGRWMDPNFLDGYLSKAEELEVGKGGVVEIRLLEIDNHR